MKQWKHKCELKLLMCQPNPMRPDRVTVGYVLRDTSLEAARIEVRFAQNLSAVRCIYPDADLDAIQAVLLELESVLKNVTDVESYLQHLPADFPGDFALLPGTALLTDSIDDELAVLDRQYLVRPKRSKSEKSEASLGEENEVSEENQIGRPYLRRAMQQSFSRLGITDLLLTEIPVSHYTFQGDLLKIDFGYRHNPSTYRLLHATSVVVGLDQTAMLAVEWPKIRKGFQNSIAEQCEMVAIVEAPQFTEDEKSQSAKQWLTDAGIKLKPVTAMMELAVEIRDTLRP